MSARVEVPAIPSWQELTRPVLAAMADGSIHSEREIRTKVLEDVGATLEQRRVMLPKTPRPMFDDHIHWALNELFEAKAVQRVSRGAYQVTERGNDLLIGHPEGVPKKLLMTFPEYAARQAEQRIRRVRR
ncbi:winged helix-turn-helix domain-containing protein [Sinomonas flava]|uniref:winged helix-turn-helix domain-containing protein n=1 Tax=Sinomonas flava TaxID=496857 RepID=UPI0039A4D996